MGSTGRNLPPSWIATTVGDVYEVVGGGTPSTENADYWNGHVPWITSADIEGVRRINVRKHVSEKGIAASTANKVPAKTLLVVTRVGLGKVAITDTPLCFSQDLQGLMQDPELISPEYALYLLSYELQFLKFAGQGTTISGVTKKQLKDLAFPLPPITEQHRIVAKIEELFSELDQGVASLKTAREQLKVYRQSLLKHAFEGKLTPGIGWRDTTIGSLLCFLTSGSRGWARYYATEGDLFIRAQNIKHDYLNLDDIAFVSLPDRAEGLRTRIQPGDLLITITGANVTKTALVKHDLGTAYVSQHVALCRPTEEIFPEFLYRFIVAEAAGRRQLTEMAYGAGKPGLNLENIRSVEIRLPSLSEQEEIIRLIDEKLSEADQLYQTLATALQQADALRQSILKKAFSGQLVPQDENDEPAAVLLERIRAERNASPAKGRKTKLGSKLLPIY
ncbi:MAG: restriction endonuclease subunit S [Actinomycetota bacterium]